ncbi:OTU domain-containing protein 6A [Orcinus orca]|uniref:OTU domain-containing protein 6A-like n=1 Tax=Orcinus orca TaxID=9733 RepID=UPI0002BCF9FD|nr:OTU domain-containing protein 6A-like [Orcinus orca]XP_049560595.1 OTU domain-containing protein 6A [Orcinus orca]XP_049560597.1 OTU domain-containing protein 6A [Orcinus orca]
MGDSQSEHQRMLRRHSREKTELQAHIQGMKSSIPKSDKQRRKQLLLDVARLEAEMEQKHQQELEKFQESFPDNSSLDSVTEDLAKLDLENKPPHLWRAQRKHKRKEAFNRESQDWMDKAEMEHLASLRHDEEMKLGAILRAKHLEVKDIPADDHCMYRAIQDQLVFSVTVGSLRRRTAEYMRQHVDDFLPFFSNPETGDACSRDDFLSYCDDIVFSASCGSQLELRALSHVLQTPIEVIQANSPAVVIGEEYTKKPLTLVCKQYSYSSAEHYNSVKPLDTGSGGSVARRLI